MICLEKAIFFLLQKREKGRLRVHHINNVNRALYVLEHSYNVSTLQFAHI